MHELVNEGDACSRSVRRATTSPHSRTSAPNHPVRGGIGITPILCMAERLAALREPFELHYCTRSPDRTAFLKRIRISSFNDAVRFHFDDNPLEQQLDARSAKMQSDSSPSQALARIRQLG
ncbi:ferredoxin reductase domain-containing protein [Caenimonas soli]|uniref:hypothetical protein n=1 Tax=Caenimonas soli TaxID=2735555 RepID=UPI001551FA3A|nr:hypothetical protein [Caenimonas soli]